MYGREKGRRSVNVKLKKKYIKNNYKKMERKKIMTWTMTWLNVSAAALNATFQLLVIYRFKNGYNLTCFLNKWLIYLGFHHNLNEVQKK